MVIFLSKKSKTGRELASQLNMPLYRATMPIEATFAIRWGNVLPATINTLNTREAIMKASDKASCRKLLSEAGLPVPDLTETDFPVIGRTRYHSQGRGFWYCSNSEDVARAKLQGAVYFSKFYPKKEEYRVHIGSGKVLLFSIKEGDKTQLIWNKRKSGFKFRHMRRSEWREDNGLMAIQRACKKALTIIGLDFGAVDVMAGASDSEPFVISEINTAPSLSPLAMSKYVSYFQTRLGID